MHNAWKSITALTLVLGACGGDDGTPPQGSVFTTLGISAANLNLVDGDTARLTATPRDQNGAPMSLSGAATFTVSGTAASVSTTGLVTALAQGASTVTASLTAAGVTRTATTNVNVSALPTSPTVTASSTGQTFDPDTVKVATGGTVTWSFPGIQHNVIWDGTAPPGGNISAHSNGESEGRTFPNAGTYLYHCSIHGPNMDGRVIVRTP